MSALDAKRLLEVWEQAEELPPLQRVLLLLHAAWPHFSLDEWAEMALGRRDWHLMYLRQQLFGEQLEALAVCPACGEQLEMSFGLGQICPDGWQLAQLAQVLNQPDCAALSQAWLNPVELKLGEGMGDTSLLARAPTTADLLATRHLSRAEAYQALLARCLQWQDPSAASVSDLAEELKTQAMQAISHADPLAEIKIDLDCPACQHAWQLDFDIAQWLWQEIADWVPRILQQVHVLASSYGWSEQNILALSARRRTMYLQMLGQVDT